MHSRGKKLEEGINFNRVARATAGSTGADLMNVMNTAGMVAVRRGAKVISEDDIFQVRTRFCQGERPCNVHRTWRTSRRRRRVLLDTCFNQLNAWGLLVTSRLSSFCAFIH